MLASLHILINHRLPCGGPAVAKVYPGETTVEDVFRVAVSAGLVGDPLQDRPSSFSARSTTFAAVKPSCSMTTCPGADAPNRVSPITSPSVPT